MKTKYVEHLLDSAIPPKPIQYYDIPYGCLVPKSIDNLVNDNPQSLFEFLDEYKIYCCITIKYEKGIPKFYADINGAVYENSFDTRKEATVYCIQDALKMLNDLKQDS